MSRRFLGCLLQSSSVGSPLISHGRAVRVADPHSRLPVDELTQDIGVPGVPGGLGDHMHQDLEGRLGVRQPPRHDSGRIEVEGADRGIGVRRCRVVERDDLLGVSSASAHMSAFGSAPSSSHGVAVSEGRPNTSPK